MRDGNVHLVLFLRFYEICKRYDIKNMSIYINSILHLFGFIFFFLSNYLFGQLIKYYLMRKLKAQISQITA